MVSALGKILPLLVAAGEPYEESVGHKVTWKRAAFSSLRVFALSGRNWTLTTVVGLLSLVPFGANSVSWRAH